MSIPSDRKYTKDHEWTKVEGNIATIGITDHAQEQLGDVVYLELPEEHDELIKDENFGVVESTKAVSDLKAPVSGNVVEMNEELLDQPEDINQSPYDKGWMIRVELSDESELDDLLSPEDYEKIIEED